jgi:hypothetical protein
MGPIAEVVAGAIKPIADLIGQAHFSGEERATAQLRLAALQGDLFKVVMESADKDLEARKAVIVAEAQGESWLQRSWRPIVMLSFTGTILATVFGHFVGVSVDLPPQMWPLLELGIGGYVIGRSAEKALPATAEAIAKVIGSNVIGGKK